MVAAGRVGPDRPPLPAVAVRGSGSGLPAEEGPQEEPRVFMRPAEVRVLEDQEEQRVQGDEKDLDQGEDLRLAVFLLIFEMSKSSTCFFHED